MQTDRLLPPSSTSIREFVVQPPNSFPVEPLADLVYPLVVLTDLDPELAKVFTLMKLHKVMKICDTLEEGMKVLRG